MKTTTVLGAAGMAAVLALAGAIVHAPATVAKAVDATPVTVTNRLAEPLPISLTPANPWSSDVTFTVGAARQYTGPGPTTQSLNITAINISNSSPSHTIKMHFYAADFLPDRTIHPPCTGIEVLGTGRPDAYAFVPPMQTVHLTFPTPMVFAPIHGQVCIAADKQLFFGDDEVDITFNGYMQ